MSPPLLPADEGGLPRLRERNLPLREAVGSDLERSVREILALPAAPVRNVRRDDVVTNLRGLLFHEKAGGRFDAESLGEFRLAMAMRDDPTVAAFRAQPETFHWTNRDDATRRYTPDFVVLLGDGSLVYREVKTSDDYARDPMLDERRDDIVDLCRLRGARFEIWTEIGLSRGRIDGTMTCRIALS